MGWGPYRGRSEATQRLTTYADAVFQRSVGVLWSGDGETSWLRSPAFDGAGDGLALMVRCQTVPPTPPLVLASMQAVETVLSETLKIGSSLSLRPSPAASAHMREQLVKPIGDFLKRHPAIQDGLVATADVVGVIAGGVALFTLITVGGGVAVVAGLAATIVAGAACLVLLYEDGQHLWYAATGDKAGRLKLEGRADYKYIEAIAPWFTLPDLVAGGRSVIREALEAGEKTTEVMSRAGTLGARSLQAGREAHQVFADPEQDWRTIKATREEAARRANDYRRMRDLANRESVNLLARRNAVLATAGGVYATGQYIREPPVLTERASDKVKEQMHAESELMYRHAEEALGAASGSAARPGFVAHLLTPSSPSPQTSHLRMNVIITHRQPAVNR